MLRDLIVDQPEVLIWALQDARVEHLEKVEVRVARVRFSGIQDLFAQPMVHFCEIPRALVLARHGGGDGRTYPRSLQVKLPKEFPIPTADGYQTMQLTLCVNGAVQIEKAEFVAV
jgi:hypothetical protein